VDILERLGLLFRYMVDRHPQSLFFGCELRFPDRALCPPNNCLPLSFLQRFVGVYRSTGLDLVYAWSRDQGKEDIRQRYSLRVSTKVGFCAETRVLCARARKGATSTYIAGP
jgi:hypothetical protein